MIGLGSVTLALEVNGSDALRSALVVVVESDILERSDSGLEKFLHMAN